MRVTLQEDMGYTSAVYAPDIRNATNSYRIIIKGESGVNDIVVLKSHRGLSTV
ncbi:hypothetical protein [Candidatus Endomicrobiellum cubanum]|uniref:hypothetical protein n=1 Tax=Candidatus Endomicrobiellum cubanum TaxID=3242325 RepID=UPI00359414F6